MEVGFIKADSTNLPKINSLMVAKFFAFNPDFCSAELRNVKTAISGRESYGDDAIGFVQLNRDQNICTVKSTVCPEHKVRSTPYAVTITVHEQEETVESVQCHDCPASAGGCKHSVAFLMWLHRRTEERSCTSVECYWRKSNLSKVGASIKILLAREITKRKPQDLAPDSGLMKEFVLECKKKKINTCQFIKYEPDFEDKHTILSLHNLMIKYVDEDCERFLLKVAHLFDDTTIKNVEICTQNQDKSKLWHEIRYGRITASKCYEVSRCKTADGTLVASILGGRSPNTPAISRGKNLEQQVRKVIEKQLEIKIKKCGLYISKECPMIAASPDGIEGYTTFEIKCPSSEKTSKNYIDKNGVITNKYMAQVQTQMYCAGTKQTYFCVASSDFERNHQVTLIKVDYDYQYVVRLLVGVISFWKNKIFPILYKSVTNV